MSKPNWFVRCLPALSFLAIIALTECALRIGQTLFTILRHSGKFIASQAPIAQYLFVAYVLALHVITLGFPLRLIYAARSAADHVERVHSTNAQIGAQAVFEYDNLDLTVDDDPEREGLDVQAPDVVMAIVVPIYKEERHVVGDTLKMLSIHRLAKKSYDVFLAMEARDPNATTMAEEMLVKFGSCFRDMQYTTHPAGIVGEAPGKASNVNWSSQQILQKYSGSQVWEDVVLTVMDSDTHFLSSYFEIIMRKHLINRRGGNALDISMYVPPIIFDRNAHQVPMFVKLADIMWSGAGLSCFQATPHRRAVIIPTSAYSVTLPLVALVNGWDCGPEAIGEDMHMTLKAFFATKGRLNIESVPSPASHCNVSSGLSGVRGYFADIKARYNQGLRHMWGCLDSGYTVHNWTRFSSPAPVLVSRRTVGQQADYSLKMEHHRSYWSRASRFSLRNSILAARIFEAHFLPLHLFIVTIAGAIYSNLPERAQTLPQCAYLDQAMSLTSAMRLFALALTVYHFCFSYQRYHTVCVDARIAELRRAGIYEDFEETVSTRTPWHMRTPVEILMLPVVGLMYGSIPLMQAAFSHFWTENLEYKVSLKPKKKGHVKKPSTVAWQDARTVPGVYEPVPSSRMVMVA